MIAPGIHSIIPAQAGIQNQGLGAKPLWAPACAGALNISGIPT